MKVKEIQAIAKSMKLKTGKLKKAELIQMIQREEGNDAHAFHYHLGKACKVVIIVRVLFQKLCVSKAVEMPRSLGSGDVKMFCDVRHPEVLIFQ